MKRISFSLGISLLLLCNFLNAQGFTRYDSIPVTVNSNTLQFPWCGGLNFSQMYRIDMNGDGLKDLFVYDKSTAKHRTYLNTGGTGDYQYVYHPEYEWRFPGPFDNWVALYDFNCDGREDIFTYRNGFIQVWKNDYTTQNGLQFSLYINILYATYPTSGYSNILISNQTYPGFADVDHDGDLDILVYGIDVDWYENMAQENFSRCDTLVFNFADDCWGKFASYGNPQWNTLYFNFSCRSTGPGDTTQMLHAGQCILPIDLDGDNDYDVLIGDVIQNNITAAFNAGTPSVANMQSQDTAFPNYNVPVASFTLNVPFYLDLDNDGVKDLQVSPFQRNVSDNFNSTWFYKNTGTNSFPVFNFQQGDYLQHEMIETGEGCYPVFFDYDNDGKQDLIIGNYGYYSPQVGNGFASDLSLYRNTGTATVPSFQLVTRDYGRIDSLVGNLFMTINNTIPTFGDLDGDGDADLLAGMEDGRLLYFNNTAGSGNPCQFTYVTNFYDSLDVGNFAAPQLIDVDRDNDLDLIIGNQLGKIWYYRNTGTSSSPVFSTTPTNNFFGGVSVKKSNSFTGFSVPCMFDSAGTYQLMVGSESGYLYYYKNIDGNLSGNFTLVDTAFENIWTGTRTAPSVKDINGDGLFDLVVGNYSGGVDFYKGDLSYGIHDPALLNFEFTIYPNPANEQVSFGIQTGTAVKQLELDVYNVLGTLLKKVPLSTQERSFSLATTDLAPGIYICRLRVNGAYKVKKLIIER